MSEPRTPHWETLDHSVQGVNKARNQDWCLAEGSGTARDPLILSVADGHGSAVHSRSHVGARFATDHFLLEAQKFAELARAEDPDGAHSLSWLMNYARNELPRQLVAAWQHAVLGHWSRSQESTKAVPPVPVPRDDQKLLLYGSTLIGVVVTPRLFAAWQLGDGELAVIEDDGEISLPLAPAEADLGDETESLCSRHAWKLIRVHWAPIVTDDHTPQLISLSTDGLSKSFASDEGFAQFMAGFGQRLSDEGTAVVRAALPEWLAKAARYSGDDTTLAAARRPAGTTEHSMTTDHG